MEVFVEVYEFFGFIFKELVFLCEYNFLIDCIFCEMLMFDFKVMVCWVFFEVMDKVCVDELIL